MKNIIAITSLLAAGTVLATAETTFTTVDDSYIVATGNGNYYGFVTSLNYGLLSSTTVSGTEATLAEFAAGMDLNFDSITFTIRGGNASGNTVKLAVYEYTGDRTTGTFVGLSENALRDTTVGAGNLATFTFDGIIINSATKYQFLFVDSSATAETVDSFIEYQELAKQWGILVGHDNDGSTSIAPGYGTYTASAINSWETQYVPKYSIVTSIPEPSAFGLLAGLGALALAGSRRRRRKA